MKKWIALVLMFFVVASLLYFLSVRRAPINGREDLSRHQSLDEYRQEVQKPSETHLRGIRRERKHQEAHFEIFQEIFGSNLRAEFAADHRVYRIQGEIGQGERGLASFTPNDQAQVTQRAAEILSHARDLLGISPLSPVDVSQVSLGKISAQVYYKQKFQSYRIVPDGNLKVDLGPHGELISLQSSYVSEFQFKNHPVFNLELAQKSLAQFFTATERSIQDSPLPAAEKVIWVQSKQSYYAFQFITSGMMIVIDSESGLVLSSKDMKKS